MSTKGARKYFLSHVLPSVSAWRDSTTDLQLAMHAAVSLNQMADYFWHEFSEAVPTSVLNQHSLKEFRKVLGTQFPSFALIRDVAEAHKHVKLNRNDRVLTGAEQTTVGNLGYGEAEYGVGTYGGGDEIVVELDSGQRRHFSAVVADTETMWVTLLASATI